MALALSENSQPCPALPAMPACQTRAAIQFSRHYVYPLHASDRPDRQYRGPRYDSQIPPDCRPFDRHRAWVCVIDAIGLFCPDIDRFKKGKPSLSLAEFFAGETIAYGIFEDRFGQLKRQFRVHIDGRTEQGKLILDEQFLYDDGEQAQRIWTITSTQTKDGFIRYEGSADDVTGTATGKAAGNVLSWSYDIELAIGDNDIEVRFDDFIYQMSDNLAINRAHVTKWGVELGTVTLVFFCVASWPSQNWQAIIFSLKDGNLATLTLSR